MSGCHVPIYKQPETCICVYCLDYRLKKLEDKHAREQLWKNAKTDVPSQDNIVLVYTSDKQYYIANYFKDENVFRLPKYSFQMIEVSHWMYLPPSPKN